MKQYTCLFIIRISILALLISCNGKQRPLNDSQVETNSTNKSIKTSTSTNIQPSNTQTHQANNEITKQTDETINNENTASQTRAKLVFSDVQPLIQKHCVYCHFPGNPPQIPTIDWMDYITVKSYVDNRKLYERIWTLRKDAVQGMPMGNGLGMTEEERKKIVQWIEDGGLQ